MNILLVVDPKETNYVQAVRQLIPQHNTAVYPRTVNYMDDIDTVIRRAKSEKNLQFHAVVTSSLSYLKVIVKNKFAGQVAKQQAEKILHLYAGAVFDHEIKDFKTKEVTKLPILCLPALKTIHSQSHGKFLMERYLRKIYDPSFPMAPPLEWRMLDSKSEDWKALEAEFNSALLVGVDIETTLQELPEEWADLDTYEGVSLNGIGYLGNPKTKSGSKAKRKAYLIPKITHCGYTVVRKDLTSKTYVLTITSMEDVYLMRNLNATAAPKSMQNGRYDSMYFLRYAAPLYNWIHDTYMMFHAWYAELPRSLDAISAFMLRNHMYWKDESKQDMAEYNAKDCHVTAWSTIYMWNEMPDWAKANYYENFPKIFPSIHCGVEGFKVDYEEYEKVKTGYQEKLEAAKKVLELRTGTPNINANSSKQMTELLNGVGFRCTSSDSKTLTQFKETNAFYEVLAEAIENVRENNKAVSTYMNIAYFGDRLLYELDPSGTDTGRFASKASSFWCGTQVQNIPLYAKSMYVADEGYVLCAIDNGQSESRCTAYISGDENLINTVEDDRDFHKVNASLFFGLDYEQITKSIRNVAKRVNHGANYNMGPKVMLETMGTRAVLEAKRLLGLPDEYTPIDVCDYLLGRFSKAYPKVKGDYYRAVIREITETSRLTGATGWTRYCFGHPNESKMKLNSYVAHPPQSLSVKMINASFYDAWRKYQIEENIIRTKAQVHDEIIFQVKPENLEYAVDGISKLMERPVKVYGRDLIIPNDPITGKHRWSDLKD